MSLRQNHLWNKLSSCHCLITSQNVTAPKQCLITAYINARLVTSQNVTAPKLIVAVATALIGLVTSQNITAPKPPL